MSDPVSPAPERAAGADGTPTPMTLADFPEALRSVAAEVLRPQSVTGYRLIAEILHVLAEDACFAPVAAPRAGGADEPKHPCPAVDRGGYQCELSSGHLGVHRAFIGASDELGAIPELQWGEFASPVGATSAPASEPTTEADVEALCDAIRATIYGDDRQSFTTLGPGISALNTLAATVYALRARLASQASALAAVQTAVEGWDCEGADRQAGRLWELFAGRDDVEMRCAAANLRNANRIIRTARAATHTPETDHA